MKQTIEAASRLKEVLQYNPATGEFFRVANGVTKPTGTVTSNGYRRLTVDGVQYLAHRVAWLFHYGDWPDDQVDHINRDRLDNRIANLRRVSNSENMANLSVRTNSKSGVPGVCWFERTKRWMVRMMVNGKVINIGYFKCYAHAIKARRKAEIENGVVRFERRLNHV